MGFAEGHYISHLSRIVEIAVAFGHLGNNLADTVASLPAFAALHTVALACNHSSQDRALLPRPMLATA